MIMQIGGAKRKECGENIFGQILDNVEQIDTHRGCTYLLIRLDGFDLGALHVDVAHQAADLGSIEPWRVLLNVARGWIYIGIDILEPLIDLGAKVGVVCSNRLFGHRSGSCSWHYRIRCLCFRLYYGIVVENAGLTNL
jgi:hypothetical protein